MATTAWTYDDISAALQLREREGLSWRALSARTGHPVWRLRYGARRLAARAAGRAGGFIELVPSREAAPPIDTGKSGCLTIELENGIRLLVEPGVDLETLRGVVRTMRGSC